MQFQPISGDYTDSITGQVGPGAYTKTLNYPSPGAGDGIWLASSYGSDSNTGLSPAQAVATYTHAKSLRDASHPYIYVNDSETYTISAKETFNSASSKGIVAAIADAGITGSVDAAPTFEFTDLADQWVDAATNDFHMAGLRLKASGPMDPTAVPVVLTQCDDSFFSYNSIEAEFTYDATTIAAAYGYLVVLDRCDNSTVEANVAIGNSAWLIYFTLNGESTGCTRNILYRKLGPSSPASGASAAGLQVFPYSSRTINYSSAAQTATITSGSMTVNAYQGKYLYDTGTLEAYKILSNTATIFYLEDTFGTGIPGTSGVSVLVIDKGFDTAFGATGNGTVLLGGNLVIGESPLDGGFMMEPNALTTLTVIAFDNVALNAAVLLGIVPDDTSGTQLGTLSLSNNYAASAGAIYDAVLPDGTAIADPPSMTITNADEVIAPSPLLLNQTLLASAPDTTDYTDSGWLEFANAARLKRVGARYHESDSVWLTVDSPLVGQGLGYDDIGPWVEAVTGPTYSESAVVELQWPAEKMQITFRPINPVELSDVQGNIKTSIDSFRKIFTYNYASYANNENAWKIEALKQANSPLWFFPRDGESLFTASEELTLSGSGDTRTALPQGLTLSLINHHWAGWWILLESNEIPFYISDSDGDGFTLIDKLGATFPSNGGDIPFSIDRILVLPSIDDFTIQAPWFLNWLKGNAWMEKAWPETAAHEYTDFQFVIKEIEDVI